MSPQASKVEGVADVARAFDELADRVERPTEVASQLAAIGVDAARAAAPSKSGELVASIHAEVGTAEADLTTDVGYGEFQEFGTVYVPALRFMGIGYGAMHERAEAISSAFLGGVLADVDRMA